MTKMPQAKYARSFPRPRRLVVVMTFNLILWLCLFALPVTLFQMFFAPEPHLQRVWAAVSLACLILGVLARVCVYVLAGNIRCPLCQGAIFRSAKCRMNENARKYPLMTYSTSMVIDMYLYRRFVCKYCGTPFRLRR